MLNSLSLNQPLLLGLLSSLSLPLFWQGFNPLALAERLAVCLLFLGYMVWASPTSTQLMSLA
jgi:hypothetical protein